MRILVDALPLSGLVTGISRYLRNLYGAMEVLEAASGDQVHYFDGRKLHFRMPPSAKPATWAKAVAGLWKLPDSAVFALRSLYWIGYESHLRHLSRRQRYDIYHETAFTPAAFSGVPQVFSLCDLSLLRYPETHPRDRVWFFEFFRRRRMPYATHILTLSQYIRDEICDVLKWPAERVTAVPLAPAKPFRPKADEDVAAARRTFGLPRDYLLFVGSLEPRKNIGLVVEALARCRTDIPLVLVGWEAWGDKSWLKAARSRGLCKRIYLLGYVDDETLACLYTGATCLVYPSLYEGFGLPIVEAMACGCPVICSNVASMPEVAGDAARLIDPEDPDDVAAAIDEVAASPGLRQDMVRRGFARAAAFHWQRTAEETRAVFRAVIEENRC